MASLQSSVVNVIARTIRSSFFIHKAETFTQRKSFERISVFTKYPRFVKSEKHTIAGLTAMSFYPKQLNDKRVILYLHGGAYCTGSVKTHKALIARIARASKCRAIGINYRLAPDHPYPAALEDALKVYEDLMDQGYENIFLAGDSAGGGLALALMLKLKDNRKKLPKGAVLISPWTDLAMTGESIRTKVYNDPLIDPKVLNYFAGLYIGEDSPTNPYISPLYGDLSNLPPILIQVGGNEVILDDSTRLAKKLKKNGCEVELEVWQKMFHVWHYLGGILPESKDAINSIGSFVQDVYQSEAAHEGQIEGIQLELA
ncbi:MAG: alpha/beta hydrolase [Bacteroidetes bacterium]|nr:alpha/beta hydrolase [Bacteroidota bacterium]